MRYLQKNKDIFHKYKVVAEYNRATNDYPRDKNGNIDSSFDDLYIPCAYHNRITDYGKVHKQHMLQAYITTKQRGHNILKKLAERTEQIVFDVQETDEEVTFLFPVQYLDIVAEYMKARKQYSKPRSPFSSKYLPKSDYKIPDKDMEKYKSFIKLLEPEHYIKISRATQTFVHTHICSRKFSQKDMRTEQRKLMLNTKEYIHYKGIWEEYLDYLRKELKC